MRAAALAVCLAACSGGDDGPIEAVDRGRLLFDDPGFSSSRFNTFACSTCHSSEVGGDPARIEAGYTLANSAFRASYWGGYEARLFDAIDFCNVFFMRGQPLDPASDEARAMYEYLVSISPEDPAEALPMTVVANVTTLAKGDPRHGEEVWNQACRICHGAVHTGKGRLTDLASYVPDDSQELADQLGVEVDLVIIEKVRHGQFFGVGGNMPLFTKEALPDAELGALLAYVLE